MSFDQCMANAVNGGEISQQDATRLIQRFEQLKAQKANGSEATAAGEAKRALEALLKAENEHEKRKAKLSLSSIRRIAADLQAHRNARGEADVASAALDMLEHFGTAQFSSVEGRRKAIIGMAHAKMENVLHHFRRGAVGGDKTRWNAAQLPNVVREAFGQDTGDQAAKGLVRAWQDTHEWLRQRFNSAGGAIGELKDWGLPQHHDARAVKARGQQQWIEDILPMLDTARMGHPLTGQAMSDRELRSVLAGIWENIATDGWIDRDPIRQPFGKGALANQRSEHRFLHFKDPDTWLEYQRNYGGGGDAFAAMMGHVNMMARDIAAMEVLGPNPNGTIHWLKQAVEKEAAMKAAGRPAHFAGKGDPQDRARRYQRRIDAVWGSIRGNLETPVSTKWANVLGATRNVITASVLGSAAISSISDLGTAALTRKFAGLDASGTLTDSIRAALPSTRREAVEAGLIHDAAQQVFHAQARYVGTLNGPAWSSYLADRVLTWSGLTPWTQAGRHAFGLAVQVEAGKQARHGWGELDPFFRGLFERYGIGQRQWELIRQAPLHEGRDGGKMLRPNEIAARIDPKLAERYLEMILSETEYAVPSGSHRSRTALLDQNQPGTFHGEIMRSFAQFKSFGATIALLHGLRATNMLLAKESRMAGMAYAGALLISTTVFGALALQLKQIAAGRDPRDMGSPEFWGAALMQGGGLGIYGDFLFADVNRYGGGFASTFGGPLMGRANDFWNLTAGNAIQLASGEKTNFGRELVKFGRGNVPGGNIWYLKLAAERLLFDQLNYLADPEANRAFKRQQQFWGRETGQEYFWRPGERAPDRLPDVSAAFR